MQKTFDDGDVYFDDGEYVVFTHVPIFDQHDGREDDKLKLVFTPGVLQEIADNSNRRMLDTGDPCVIYDEHTSDDPVAQKPILLGFATDFEVGDFGNLDPRKCIFATFKFKKETWDLARQKPRRSVELWMDDLVIDVISLLGDERPARDLGLLFSKKSKQKAKYRYELKETKMNLEEIVKKCLEAWMATPEMGWVKEHMSKMKHDMEEEEKADFNKDEEVEEEAMMKKKKAKELAEEKIEKVPGGSVELEDSEWEEDEDEGMHSEKYKIQRDQERRKWSRLNEENKQLAGRLATIEKENRLNKRKADLMQLENEGVLFDMAEELDVVGDMEVARYSKHLNHMKKRYQRGPIGVSIKAAIPTGGVAKKEADSEAVHKAAYLVKDGKAKSIEEALTTLGF